jgi:hypothetical protein
MSIFGGHTGPVTSVAFSSDGRFALSGSWDGTMRLWDVSANKEERIFTGHRGPVLSVAFSPDGRFAISSGGVNDVGEIKLWEIATGKELRSFSGHTFSVEAVAFSPDGRVAFSAGDRTARLWDVDTGRELHKLDHDTFATAVAFAPDGRSAMSGDAEGTMKTWDVATGDMVRSFRGHTGWVRSIVYSRDGRFALSGSWDGSMKLWEVDTGQQLRKFEGHIGFISSVAFSPDGRFAVSGGEDGTTRIWNVSKQRELVSMMATSDGEWLSITPEGFFAASDDGLDLASVVQGMKSYAVSQFRDKLFRADLVRLHLSPVGDALHVYDEAVSEQKLDIILQSGAVPTIKLESQSEWAGDSVQLTVTIFNNKGGGIGKELDWRVKDKEGKNGQLRGTSTPRELQNLADPDGPVSVTHGFKLDPDQDHVVTVTARNGQDRMATEPYKIEVKKNRAGAVTPNDPGAKPEQRMFILAIGVNQYAEPQLARLYYPLADVTTLAEAIKSVAESAGQKVEIIKRLGPDAIYDKIKNAFAEIAAFPYQRDDTLVVLLAGHGGSHRGKYYYLPASTHFDGDRDIVTEGISSDTWREWTASIEVSKKLLIIDTCESSNATAIGRGDNDQGEIAYMAALDRIRVALGDSIVTAARQVAYEGSLLRHGVLTYSILEALGTPRPDGSMINLNSLKEFVEDAVPRWSRRLSGKPQEPSIKVSDNFPIGYPLSQLKPHITDAEKLFPGEYVVDRDAPVRELATADAPVKETLPSFTKVQVKGYDGDWTQVARQGVTRGWVPHDFVKLLH